MNDGALLLQYHIDAPWSRGMVTVVVFVDETTLDNGATVIIPGSHVALGTSYQEGVLAPGALPPAVERRPAQ